MTTIIAHALSPALFAHWKKISATLRLRTESDHRRVTAMIDELVEMVGDDRRHPLYDLLDNRSIGMALSQHHQTITPKARRPAGE